MDETEMQSGVAGKHAGSRALARRSFLTAALAAAGSVPLSVLLEPGTPARAELVQMATVPVPPPAKGPAIPKVGYLVEEIGADLYWLTDGLYQMLFLVTADGVVIVDAPPTLGNNIPRAIKTVTTVPVRYGIYSHHHADHAGAMGLFLGATLYAQAEAAALIAGAHDSNRPVPTRVFTRSTVLDVGGQTVQLAYHGPNHSPGNTFVYFPAQRTLMLVDIVFPGWVPFAYLAESQNIPGWMQAPALALQHPFTTFVGGHLTRLGTRDDVLIQQQYVQDLQTEAARAIAGFDPTPIFGEVDPTNPWAVFDAYLDALATQTADSVVPRWTSLLGGADVFTKSNAYAMVESLRIDAGQLGPFGIHP